MKHITLLSLIGVSLLASSLSAGPELCPSLKDDPKGTEKSPKYINSRFGVKASGAEKNDATIFLIERKKVKDGGAIDSQNGTIFDVQLSGRARQKAVVCQRMSNDQKNVDIYAFVPDDQSKLVAMSTPATPVAPAPEPAPMPAMQELSHKDRCNIFMADKRLMRDNSKNPYRDMNLAGKTEKLNAMTGGSFSQIQIGSVLNNKELKAELDNFVGDCSSFNPTAR